VPVAQDVEQRFALLLMVNTLVLMALDMWVTEGVEVELTLHDLLFYFSSFIFCLLIFFRVSCLGGWCTIAT
jgi:hypothetical protein